MAVVLNEHKLVYFSVPKIACTSIKHFLHEVMTGTRFEPFEKRNGRRVFIHTVYPAEPFSSVDQSAFADFRRITVVRDPVKRLLSAYSNRVVHYRELSSEKVGPRLAAAGLPADPDLDTFIANLEGYCAHFGKIRHHTLPHTHFLGSSPEYFTRIYRFSELDQMADDVRTLTGSPLALQHLQKGGPKLSVDDLSAKQVSLIRDRYAGDYEAFGAYFD